MNDIGKKIKELRKKKDMTQERLAEYLNVSFQAVSKWETGAASPDLSMIVPLARVLGVSTDELFGLVSSEEDHRLKELEAALDDTNQTGDTAKRYEIAKIAVAEYPGNFDCLLWLALAEESYAIHNCEHYSKEQQEHFKAAVKLYETIFEDCDDTDTTNCAICGLVRNLPNIGRKADAVFYAKQHPYDEDSLLMWCLSGEELSIHRQKMIERKMGNLVDDLEWGKHDLHAIRAAETVIKTIIDDGNYLFYNEALMHNYVWQAMCLTREEKFEEAVETLKISHQYAVAYENDLAKARVKPIPYTCNILSKLTFDAKTLVVSSTSTLTEDFREYLNQNFFDVLRDREDFQALYAL